MLKRKMSFITLSIAISISFILLGVFCFGDSYKRVFEAFVDLWNSIQYYCITLFGINKKVVPTIIDFTHIFDKEIIGSINPLPPTTDEFIGKTTTFFELFFNINNFKLWGNNLLVGLGNFSKILVIILPIILIVFMLIKQIYNKGNNKYNQDALPLKLYKNISKVGYEPVKRFVSSYIEFLKEYKWLSYLWIAIWAFNLNFATIIIEFIAFYLYFCMSFNLDTIYIQFCKLFMDIKISFRLPILLVLIPLFLFLFGFIRTKIAKNRLNHMEAKNCGFIKELPIVSMTCGSMGKKKTTIITDMALSQEVMFRQKAFEIIQKNDMKFPFFPWIAFELELQACMRHRTVYNLATVKQWIATKRSRYDKHNDSSLQLYGYDVKKYGLTFDDKLKINNLFDILENYALAYFIYVIESSLLVTNYSIREDNVLLSEGNFPMWNTDFFPKRYRTDEKHAHILDFDILRLGKKVIEDNKNNGSFEFGVVVITEIGKERGNNLELKEVKKGTVDTNQKNDLFNNWLKMCRHSATVDNYPFIKVFTDEQRPESWGADCRDLADIVTIVKSGEQKLALPFYTIEEMIYDFVFYRFINLYYDFRFRRGDNTLLVHILKQVATIVYRYNARLYNRFGYSVMNVYKERGVMDGKQDKSKYYLMNKKIYSRRFSTDCFSDYFNDMAKKSKVGLNDYLEYATEKANIEELKQQNSYFINSLYKGGDKDVS